jgi:hypothetical protein
MFSTWLVVVKVKQINPKKLQKDSSLVGKIVEYYTVLWNIMTD